MMKKKIDSPMRKLKLLVVLPLMAMLFYAFAVPDYRYDQMATVADPQGKGIDVKGEVRKQNGDPLPGTSIILKGSTIGTISDPKGAFALKGIPSDGELFFSYVGYKTKVQKVTGKTMNITLVADTVHLDGAKDDHVAILPPPPPPPPPPLPQDGTVIFKKGDSKNPPLIIFDGKVIPNEEMQQIKPDSIASISILKEKSATAVYGDKGKNGVILITSKRAEGVRMDKGGSYSKEKVVTDANGKEVFMVVEEMPEYPGGEMALRKFLAEQIRYPVSAQEKHIQGKVFITFVVNAEGNVEKAKIARGVDPILDAEALRVVGLLKGWKPGKQKGQPVSVAYTIPVTFALDNGKKVESASGTSKKEEVVVVGYGPSDKAEKKSATDPKEVFVVVEEMPEYPGGQNALIDYLVKNLKYPEEAKKAGITGKVFVTFVVNAEGKVENAKIARSASPSLDAEALRLVGQMPDWKPGKQRGVAVSVAYTLPISFALK
ncbi:MAG: TonB family protein, partial [Marinilabiliales bacterium]|nr:TonB family protein [Marinilabiliales bacterium]